MAQFGSEALESYRLARADQIVISSTFQITTTGILSFRSGVNFAGTDVIIDTTPALHKMHSAFLNLPSDVALERLDRGIFAGVLIEAGKFTKE